KEVYTCLNSLLISDIPPSTSLTLTIEQYYQSLKTYAHITSFDSLEYQIKIILGELVPAHDIHISIQNTRPLPQSYDHLGPINNTITLSSNNSFCSSSSSSTTNNNTNTVLGLYIKQSSKLFRQDFIEHEGVEFLFKLLQSLNYFIHDDYEYSLCQEITILILQLIQLVLCENNQQEKIILSRPNSPITTTANDNALDTIDFDF
ncbi:unnamed protein product, partial [Rotaria sp. Silwood1]